jgi:dihydropteroate synthase
MSVVLPSGAIFDLSIPRVMGILNVTPDSFFDGGRYTSDKAIVEQAERMIAEGADLLDIGGMSSRPGARVIESAEEISRVLPAIRAVKRAFPDVVLSLDTLHAETARLGFEEGVDIINDISGGDYDPEMCRLVAETKIPWIIMHMPGTPETMASHTNYQQVVCEVLIDLERKVRRAREAGVGDIIIDPGFGFGKTMDQNFQLLQALSSFTVLNCPVLVGFSRKSMIRKALGLSDAEQALNGTTVLNTMALERGASILRVHDVRPAVEAVILYLTVRGEKKS